MAQPCAYFPPLSPAQGRLSSRFGERCSVAARAEGNPNCVPKFHAGIDLATPDKPVGTVPVYSVAPARIERLESNTQGGPFAGYGNCVALRHVGYDEGWWSFAAHMHERASYLEEFRERGIVLPAGVIIGTVGQTTNGKFPHMARHLHFEVRRAKSDGSSPYPGPYQTYNVDPEAWLASRGIVFGYRGAIQVIAQGVCLPTEKDSDERVRAALAA